MLEWFDRESGVLLEGQAYLDDYWQRANDITGDVWKLESRQTFREPGAPGWDALDAGDWPTAFREVGRRRSEILQSVQKTTYVMNRVRVVELPYTPYLSWELLVLAIRAEVGEHIRVVGVDEGVHADELPELVILKPDLMYDVIYDETGTYRAARRHTDHTTIEHCLQEVRSLFDRGHELLQYLATHPVADPFLVEH